MKPYFLDAETFYSDDYSLRKMTPVEYILDPRFECIGCAIKEGLDGKEFWLDGPDLPAYFARLPDDAWFVSHNALFDSCIWAWRYGVVPKLTTCTLNVSRALISHKLKSLSLDSVAKHLGIGEKTDALPKVKGMGLAALKATPSLYSNFVDYAKTDVKLCADIFRKLVASGQFPTEELAVMDMVIRAAIQPQFILDANVLADHLNDVVTVKNYLLTKSMLLGAKGKDSLTRDSEFAKLLLRYGVQPPTKMSLKTGDRRYAFAKTDTEFVDLMDHDNPIVQTLVSARLGHKTTLEESRTKRLLAISHLTWKGNVQGLMPMPLRYSGAHTHRLSGDWSINVQNLPRGGKLRKALRAPPGHVVLTVDASQIEARLTAWLAGEDELVRQFANKEDVYSNFASEVFEKPVNKKDHPTERYVGKQAILGLGFGLGAAKFRLRLKSDSKNQTGTVIDLNDEQADSIVCKYRSKFSKIQSAWWKLGNEAISMLAYQGGYMRFGPCHIREGHITLPSITGEGNGLSLYYHELEEVEQDGWWFTHGGMRKRLYGGKLLENIVQALDRVLVIGAALRIQKEIAPYRLAQQAHDENVYIVREEHADEVARILLQEMVRLPPWADGLPLAAEVGIGQTYGDAK